MSKTPNIPAAVKVLNHAHDHCLLMRNLLLAVADGEIGTAELRGLSHVFENIMTDLECATGELDPA